jgi:zinc/manganese transport system substrate-binding protein
MRILYIITVLAITLMLNATAYANKKIQIVTITKDFGSIAKDIGGDHVSVSSLLSGSLNLHEITPKPSMVLLLKKADLIIRLGMDQDTWIDSLIQTARNAQLFHAATGYMDASINIRKLEVPTENINGRKGDIHIHGNPHYWLDPNNGLIIAEDIYKKLCLIDPKNKASYTKNLSQFKSNLTKKISEWNQKLSPYKEIKVITYHTVWSYFFDAFDIDSIGELEPLPGISPSAKHLYALKKVSEKTTFPISVLSATYYPKKTSESFAKSIGASFYSLPTNVGDSGIITYSDLFDKIINILTND